MFFLPKGSPLAENVPTEKINLPHALNKLWAGSFTGYAHLSFPSAESALLYDEGKLISAFLLRGGNFLYDLDAIRATIEYMSLNRNGTFSVFRLNAEIILGMLALIRGDEVLSAQELALIDFRAVLGEIRKERMNASLKVYTDDHAGLVFYRHGAPIGYFHDADRKIGSSPAEIEKIAGLPGARIDLHAVKSVDEMMPIDLNGLIDIQKTWSAVTDNIFITGDVPPSTAIVNQAITENDETSAKTDLAGLETRLAEVAVSHLGKLGRTLIEKELANIGGIIKLLIPENLDNLLLALEKSSKLLTSSSKIKEMKASIRAEVALHS